MYGLLIALTALFNPTATVAFTSDSVIVTVNVADNTTAQPVNVDSVFVYAKIDRGVAGTFQPGDSVSVVVPKTASPTVARLAFPLTKWGANQTLGGKLGARLGRNNPEGGAALWSGLTSTSNSAWSYTRDQQAPNAPESGKVTAASVGLN